MDWKIYIVNYKSEFLKRYQGLWGYGKDDNYSDSNGFGYGEYGFFGGDGYGEGYGFTNGDGQSSTHWEDE